MYLMRIILLTAIVVLVVGGTVGAYVLTSSDIRSTAIINEIALESPAEATAIANSTSTHVSADEAQKQKNTAEEKKTMVARAEYVRKDGSRIVLEDEVLYVMLENNQKQILATIADGISNFALAPDENELYVLNTNGELYKKPLTDEDYSSLVVYGKDMHDAEIVHHDWYTNATTTHPYVKGKVLDFWLSPNGAYVVYLIQSGLTGCCASPPTIPTTRLMVMRNDGSGKQLIDHTPHGGSRTHFSGWLFDSSAFVFYDAHPDENMDGSPFYVGSPERSDVTLFKGMRYEDYRLTTHTVTVALGEPHFSPTDDLVAYRLGGYSGTKIVLVRTNGDDARILMEVAKYALTGITWSDDGTRITVTADDKVSEFQVYATSDGNSHTLNDFKTLDKQCVLSAIDTAVTIDVPSLFSGLTWTELSPEETKQYEEQAMYVQSLDTGLGPNVTLRGKAWTARYEHTNLDDHGPQSTFEEYYNDFFLQNGWSLSKPIRGYTITGIMADHPTGAASLKGYVQIHEGALRTITLHIARKQIRDSATAEKNYDGNIVGVSETTFTVFVSDTIPVKDIAPGYSPSTFIGLNYKALSHRIEVHSVVENSPADKAQIIKGDIISLFDGKKIDSQDTFGVFIQERCPGDMVTLRVLSGDIERDVSVTLDAY